MAGQLIRRGKRRFLAPMFVVGTLAISGCEDPTSFSPEPPPEASRSLLAVAAGAIEDTELKLTAGDPAADDWFGFSVSISGDWAIVGAPLDGSKSGSAYVFSFDGTSWTEEAKLTASDGAARDQFGFSVSISGDLAIVGARLDGSNSGSAYVFRFDGTSWTEEKKLTASDGAAGHQFGFSVSISGDWAIVGAPLDDDAGLSSGSAYVFRSDGTSWTEEKKLTASDGAAGDQFGVSVSISGDLAIVGALFHDDARLNSGSAYVFSFDGTSWTEEEKLTASDGAADDRFGVSVSISRDWAIVGAFLHDDAGFNSGSAYVFSFDGTSWTEEAKLTASDGSARDRFGFSVSISGNWAIVGAFLHDDAGLSSGSAYVFSFDGTSWTEEAKLTASDGAAGDQFGVSVSISGDWAIVGAFLDRDAGTGSGSAYVYTVYGYTVAAPTPAEATQAMIDEVRDLVSRGLLSRGQGNSFIAKLKAALKQLNRDNVKAAVNQLQAFINHVNAYVRSGRLTDDEGQSLIDAVQAIIDALAA